MLQKFGTVYLIILASVIVSGLYGILHDQITYSISPEYYTKFKFYQFGLEDYFYQSPRLGVALVGVQATWFLGLAIGILIGLVSFLHKQPKQMLLEGLKALGVVLLVTALVPVVCVPIYFWDDLLCGVHYARYLTTLPDFVPPTVKVHDHFAFFVVGTIHNLSYLGGMVGMLAGIMYHVWSSRKPSRVNLATL
ncbi:MULTISPECIES: hypothetical protein [Rufibacter]|uniref:Signal peptide-containing protein n=1 Tax=Rufibacter quisquiliarum TaxID=1549639 RepID=A0A839GCU5_9BACT|nr:MULTISPECIES: hypothetical protein [Rufibacter]MBA9076732.1 hypothetical protein [Rufibacter quisquiliarum]